uniref:O-acyltransferase WSD1-like n=1 Tax=Nicotiana sylvestris TaxID=4096 RepID=A0A1U7VFQ4_NICSY|nr:PREDICTED: O-acyltransferase WSD1-like [Nicotiana sylvestris]
MTVEVEGKRKFLLERRRCRATTLVNLRPALGDQAISEMIEKNAVVIQENCFAFVIIPLNIAPLENPLDYVRKAKTTMDRIKHSLASQCAFYVLQLILKFFGFKGVTTLAKRLPSQTTLVFSNVVGPVEEASWSGHPLASLAPTCYGHPTVTFFNQASNHVLITSRDQLYESSIYSYYCYNLKNYSV